MDLIGKLLLGRHEPFQPARTVADNVAFVHRSGFPIIRLIGLALVRPLANLFVKYRNLTG